MMVAGVKAKRDVAMALDFSAGVFDRCWIQFRRCQFSSFQQLNLEVNWR
jgi:hypothetical protein